MGVPNLDDLFAQNGPLISLSWSVDAMVDAIDRVNKVEAGEPDKAFAAIGEAVWWTTVVNDTLHQRHEAAYELAMSLTTPPIEDAITGLRSVRHRIGHEVDFFDLVEPAASRPDPGDGRVTAWCWKHIRPPTRRRQVDIQQHHAYEDALAGRNVVEGFTAASLFLRTANENAKGGYQKP